MADTPMWSEDDFERRAKTLAAHIRRVWRLIASAISGSLQGKAFVTQSDVGEIPSQWNELVNDVVIGYVTNVYTAGVNDIVQLAGDVPSDARIGDDLVDNHIREVRRRLRGIGDDVWQVARDEIAFGVRQGESVAEIAERVRNVTGVSTGRSLTIARTEVHAAYEAGAYDQAFFVDSDATKIWLATNDERTRPTHRAADGQRQRISDAFSVGGSELRYPGDPLGQPGETINCRCTTMYDFDIISLVSDDEMSDDDALSVTAAGKKFDSKKHPRGKDGRFIKKGAVFTVLTKPKLNIVDALNAANEIDQKTWDNLTDEQQNKITTAVNKIPDSSLFKKQLDNFNQIVKSGSDDTDDTDDDVGDDDAVSSYPPPPPPSSTVPTATSTLTPTSTSTNVGIPAHKGASIGTPAKVSTALIWGKYPAGTIILDTADGSEFVEWDGKKYIHSVNGEEVASWSKKDAYATLKNDTHWVVPEPTDVSMSDDDESDSSSAPSTPTDIAAIPLSTPAPKTTSGLKGNPGDPVKVTTGVIWGKYDPNTTILSSVDGKDRVYWDGKKYLRQSLAPDGSWQTNATWSKKDAYAELKGDVNWVVPKSDEDDASTPTVTPTSAPAPAPIPTLTPTSSPVTPPTYTSHDVIDDWSGIKSAVKQGKYTQYDVIALSTDGKYEIVINKDVDLGTEVSIVNKQNGQKYHDTSDIFGESFINSIADKWVVPSKTLPPAADLVDSTDTASEFVPGHQLNLKFYFTYVNANKINGKVIAVNKSKNQKIAWSNKHNSYVVFSGDDVEAGSPIVTIDAIKALRSPNDGWSIPAGVVKPSDYVNYIPPPTDDEINGILYDASFGPIYGSDAKNLISVMTSELFAKLTPEQKKYLNETYVSSSFFLSDDDIAKWNNLKSSTVDASLTLPDGVSPETISTNTIMSMYDMSMFVPGTEIAISSDGKYRIFATHSGAVLVSKQADGSWGNPSDYYFKDGITEMLQKHPGVTWHKPITSTSGIAPSTTSTAPSLSSMPSSPSSPLAPTTPSVTTTPIVGVNLPYHVKQSFKKAMKDAGVGHFSAADKIWKSIVEIQKNNIDIGTGQPKYTPLQILQVLDSYTKSSKTATPWQDKIKKWGATSLGYQIMKSTDATLASVFSSSSSSSSSSPSVSLTAMPTVSTDADGNVTVNDVPLGKSDISHLTSDQKDNIYAAFKNYSDTYLTSPENSILNAAKNVAQTYSLSPYQVLSVIDDAGAKKFSVTNTNPFLKKITDWLKTPQGAAKALGKPIPKPPRPDYSPGIDPNKSIPSFEESSKYTYDIVSTSNATAWFNEVIAKYGEYTPSQAKGLKHYTGGSYISINNYLRGHETTIAPTNMSAIKQAQAGMRPSLKPVLLKRGQGYNGIGNASSHEDLLKMVGQTWRNEGFTSTSVGSTPAFGGSVLLEIEAPPGTPMAWVDPISMHKGEEEMVLGAGLDFKIISVVQSGYKSVVRVRVVPNPEAGE